MHHVVMMPFHRNNINEHFDKICLKYTKETLKKIQSTHKMH